MPKETRSTKSSPRTSKPTAKKPKAIQSHHAPSFYLTPVQFRFITAQRSEYLQHRRDPQDRAKCLQDLWRKFLDAHPEHNVPPFPDDEEMVERFHLSRARALGYKLDSMLDFAAGIQHRVRET